MFTVIKNKIKNNLIVSVTIIGCMIAITLAKLSNNLITALDLNIDKVYENIIKLGLMLLWGFVVPVLILIYLRRYHRKLFYNAIDQHRDKKKKEKTEFKKKYLSKLTRTEYWLLTVSFYTAIAGAVYWYLMLLYVTHIKYPEWDKIKTRELELDEFIPITIVLFASQLLWLIVGRILWYAGRRK